LLEDRPSTLRRRRSSSLLASAPAAASCHASAPPMCARHALRRAVHDNLEAINTQQAHIAWPKATTSQSTRWRLLLVDGWLVACNSPGPSQSTRNKYTAWPKATTSQSTRWLLLHAGWNNCNAIYLNYKQQLTKLAKPHRELTLGATPVEDQHYLYLGLALVALLLIMLAKRRRSARACV
jgi:hypothetical protein